LAGTEASGEFSLGQIPLLSYLRNKMADFLVRGVHQALSIPNMILNFNIEMIVVFHS
jgi:hypothetical protein